MFQAGNTHRFPVLALRLLLIVGLLLGSLAPVAQAGRMDRTEQLYIPSVRLDDQLTDHDPEDYADTMILSDSAMLLPKFQLPWDSSWNGKIRWTGGPHAYGTGEQLSITVDAGTGSGLDFAAEGAANFEVLNMADGIVIESRKSECSSASDLGCRVAVRHSVGGSVMIYGHLQAGTIEVNVGDPLAPGSPIARAGESGTDNVHLHIDLRRGNADSFFGHPSGPFGHPFGWDDGLILVDGYQIRGYYVDGEGLRIYNYEGSAVKGSADIIPSFPFMDSDRIRKTATVVVDSGFTCQPSASTCEDNFQRPNHTQFAKVPDGGIFYAGSYNGALSVSSSVVPPGILHSSNRRQGGGISTPSTDNATFVADVNFPDPSIVSPGQSLVKTWRLRNSGTTTWGSGYHLVFRSGQRLGAVSAVALPTVAPGQSTDISVNLQIPSDSASGSFRGDWQLRNPQGVYFGHTVWYDLRLAGSQPGGGNASNGDLVSVVVPSNLQPGQTFRPEVTVRVSSGQLRQDRGDMLRHYGGTNYSSFPHVAVTGVVDTGQTYTFRFYSDQPFTAPSSPGTYTSVYRLWANGGWVGQEIPITFTVYAAGGNRPPNKPSLTAPNNWAVAVGGAPQLCAQHNGDPDGNAITGYRFVIYESANNYDSGWVSSNCVTPTGLGNYVYKWHAQVRDSGGAVSEWSEDRHFSLESSTVTVTKLEFNPPSPSNAEFVFISVDSSGCGGVNVGGKVLVNTATDGSANGTWLKIKDIGPKTTPADEPRWQTIGLHEGLHRVRVEMKSCDGTITNKDTTYQLLRGKPSAPVLQAPAHAYWSDSRTVTFRWQPALRANNYTLVVAAADRSDAPRYVQVTLNDTQYTATFTEDYPTLAWWVTANNEHGVTRENARSLGIDRQAPQTAVNPTTTPAVSYETQFNVAWTGSDNASGIHTYDVQVRDGTDGEWRDWLTAYPHQSAIFSGQPGATYCLRTRARDVAGNVEAYPDTADHCVQVDPTQRPPQTWWHDDYATKRGVVVANRESSLSLPAGYPVKLRFDATTTPTAAEIYAGSLAAVKGQDVRVVYGDQTQIARHFVTFSAGEVEMWFAAQAAIAPNQVATDYALYYGNAAPDAAPADLTQIFEPKNDANTAALWYFEETSGATTPDLSGKGKTITWTSAPARNTTGAIHGRSVSLNGSQWGTVAPITGNRLTAEAWIRPTVLSNPSFAGHDRMGTIAAFDSVSNHARWRINFTGHSNGTSSLQGLVEVRDANNNFHERSVEKAEIRIRSNELYHVALTYDGATIRLWLNGDVVATSNIVGVIEPGITAVFVGREHIGNPPFYGWIDGVRVSSVARTAFPYAKIRVFPGAAAGEALARAATTGPTDLVVEGLSFHPQADGTIVAQALLHNRGDFSTVNEFGARLLHQPGTPAADWRFAPMLPGVGVTLTTVLSKTQLLDPHGAPEQHFTFTLHADTEGVVSEVTRDNNEVTDVTLCLAAADAHEPNGLPTQANPLSLGVPIRHNIDVPGDEDWLRFDAVAGRAYRIETHDLGYAADTYLDLFAADGVTHLASSDDDGDGLASRITWTAPESGSVLVRARHWNASIGGCGTSYSLSLLMPPPLAAFQAAPTSGEPGLGVSFTDTSAGSAPIVAWLWNFGDGATSSLQHPVHLYNRAGAFTVTLTVTDSSGLSDTHIKPNFILINEPPVPPVASFTATPSGGPAPLTVSFTDTSNSPYPLSNWAWDFGDGHTATEQHPTHTYQTSGTYQATLTVTNAHGSDSHSVAIVVQEGQVTVKIPLAAGWNLISLPVVPANPDPAQLFAALAGQVKVVWAYDGCGAGDPWRKWDPAAYAFGNSLTGVAITQGLWVDASEASILTVVGQAPASTEITLCPGWNLVGYPADTRPVGEALADLDGCYDVAWGYDATLSDPWRKWNPSALPFANDLTQLRPGFGVWLQATQACTWTPPIAD